MSKGFPLYSDTLIMHTAESCPNDWSLAQTRVCPWVLDAALLEQSLGLSGLQGESSSHVPELLCESDQLAVSGSDQ